MKIFVAGGSGRVATETIRILAGQGHDIYAGARHKDHIVMGDHIYPQKLDLHAEVDALAAQIDGMDAVYFLAGSRGKDLLQTDAFGCVKLMQACEKAGIKRYVQLSSIYSIQPEKWQEEPSLASIVNYDIARFFADQWLIRNTALDYTIVGPCVLTEEPATGRIEIDPERGTSNPIPDVAAVLAGVLDKPNTFRKIIYMTGGDTPIEEALDGVE
ncbi:NAD(P)H-binding protein [uncultured Pseudoramibacter sp.]|uniref:NAD(P)H-binding protein n=1 Tax=uncultured Pseudoramibacter sp. TaxID=1623493 RepID=UPI0025D30575|nr:NAD(P)H-binding protein [uncultured Pseudoramibacter sp.]